MAWTRAEAKAIGSFAKLHNYKLTMCSKPMVAYIDQEGKLIKVHISEVEKQTLSNAKDEARERKRAEQQADREKRRFS